MIAIFQFNEHEVIVVVRVNVGADSYYRLSRSVEVDDEIPTAKIPEFVSHVRSVALRWSGLTPPVSAAAEDHPRLSNARRFHCPTPYGCYHQAVRVARR